MSSKDENPNFNDESDLIENAKNLENAEMPDIEDDEEHDFDGHDVDLDSVPSWIDEESQDHKLGFSLDDAERVVVEDDDDFNETEFDGVEDSIPSNSVPNQSSNPDVQAAIEQRDAYIEALRQLQADFENYKKRVVRDQQEYAEMKSTKLIEDLLPVVDNFELAINSLDSNDKEIKKFKKGVELVYSELFSLLERQGLERIDPEGEEFDPELHDAVMHEDNGEHDTEVVVEVLRQGYKVRGRVLRPAMVKVAK